MRPDTALGVPFIASDSGGIPELVHPEDRARVLFRPTPRHLADKLEVRTPVRVRECAS